MEGEVLFELFTHVRITLTIGTLNGSEDPLLGDLTAIGKFDLPAVLVSVKIDSEDREVDLFPKVIGKLSQGVTFGVDIVDKIHHPATFFGTIPITKTLPHIGCNLLEGGDFDVGQHTGTFVLGADHVPDITQALHLFLGVRGNKLGDRDNGVIEFVFELLFSSLTVSQLALVLGEVEAGDELVGGSVREPLDVFAMVVGPLIKDPLGNAGNLTVGDLGARFGNPNIRGLDRHGADCPVGEAKLIGFFGFLKRGGGDLREDCVVAVGVHIISFPFYSIIYK